MSFKINHTVVSKRRYSGGVVVSESSGPSSPVITGGVITDFNGFRYHTFLTSGDLSVQNGTVSTEWLLVGGGGAGNSERYWGSWNSAGGGAGGLAHYGAPVNGIPLSDGTYSIVVGAGAASSWYPSNGSNSVAYLSNTVLNSDLIAYGGGGGGDPYGWNRGGDGGSGGGAGGLAISGIGQGFNGGNGSGGSGGGAGGPGNDTGYYGSNGGVGADGYSEWGVATNTGELVNGVRYYAGGGAGLGWPEPYQGAGGHGGGSGNQRNGSGPYPGGYPGLPNTGGGGNSRGNGGSGIVIVRYAIPA
jgi:hypothetical protein